MKQRPYNTLYAIQCLTTKAWYSSKAHGKLTADFSQASKFGAGAIYSKLSEVINDPDLEHTSEFFTIVTVHKRI